MSTSTVHLFRSRCFLRFPSPVVVSYTDPTPGDDEKAIQDAAGNDAASFTVTATNNSTTTDTTPPSLVSVVVEDTGNQITLTFDEDVHITRNPADGFDDSPFSITADGQPVSRTARATIRNVIGFSGLFTRHHQRPDGHRLLRRSYPWRRRARPT